MCTVILGVGVFGPDEVLIGANRDERPGRASAPPGVLSAEPRVIGGRDLVAGGTWLAVRERRAVVALLNRRPRADETPVAVAGRRSRGLLTLDIARTREGPDDATLADACERAARAAFAAASYGPCTLLFASPERCWIASHDGGRPLRVETIERGWHVITHEDMDDRAEPRTAWLLERLARAPGTREAARALVIELLATHADARTGTPAVCIHEGSPMLTVSSAMIRLMGGEAQYFHAEGPPCTHPYTNQTHWLAEGSATGERT